jgi:hypothetical protein
MVQGVRASGIGGPSRLARDDAKAGDTSFSMDEAAAAPSQNARLSTIGSIGLESMLALQTVDEADERNRAARKRGNALIGALTKLQRAMLGAEDPSLALRALNVLASDGPEADDPQLGAILRAIVVRSRVEVARRARSDARQEAARQKG